MAFSVETVRCADFSMDYVRFGEGTGTFVILPGLSVQSVLGSANSIAAAYAPLAADHTVYLFDRRKELPPVYSVADMARDTAEAMRTLGLGPADLFGASQGGMIAQEIAVRYPELVRRLALGSTTADFRGVRTAAIERWIAMARAGDAEGLYLAFGETVYPAEFFGKIREGLRAFAGLVTREELDRFVILASGTADFSASDRLSAVRCPVLLLSAADDRVLGPDAADSILQAFAGRPDFEHIRYDGYGHAAYDLAPDYKEQLSRFFRKEAAE